MMYWILPSSAIPISCNSVQKVTQAELATTVVLEQTHEYTSSLVPRMTANAAFVNVQMIPRTRLFDFDNEEEEFL